MKRDLLEFRLAGKNISPDKVSVKELSDLLLAFESSVKAFILIANPNFSEESNILSLVNIERGSLRLQCKPIQSVDRNAVLEGFEELSHAITDKSSIPGSALPQVRKISTFNKRHDSVLHLGLYRDGKFEKLAEFSSIKTSNFKCFEEHITVYGELVKIGGEDSPKAYIKEFSGRIISGDIEKEKAKKYSPYLYTEVRADGLATISGRTLTPQTFRVFSIIPYKTLSISNSIEAIREAISSQKYGK